MPKKIPMLFLAILILFLIIFSNTPCSLFSKMGSPTGGVEFKAFYITKKPMTVKNILIPAESKIVYDKEASSNKNARLDEPLSERRIKKISFFNSEMKWAGTPIQEIEIVENIENKMLMVTLLRYELSEEEKKFRENSPFLKYWDEEDKTIALKIKNGNDWSFQPDNLELIDLKIINYDRALELIKSGKMNEYSKEDFEKDKDFQTYKKERSKFIENLKIMNEEMKKHYLYLQKIKEGK